MQTRPTRRGRSRFALIAGTLLSAVSLPGCRGGAAANEPHGTAPAIAAAPVEAVPPPPQGGKETASSAAPSSEEPAVNTNPAHATTIETATLGAGCFWCIEAVLERIDGVLAVDSGFMGGTVKNPSYESVCNGTTGHAEVVQVRFDPARLSYRQLLDWFFQAHDPTTLDRQGNDVGTQYRSAIFWHDEQQRATAEAAKAAWQDHYGGRIVTEVTRATEFWRAEDYHQDYFRNNPNQPYCRRMIPPKLQKLGLDQKK